MFTGVYEMKNRAVEGYLEILQLPGNKIKYFLQAIRPNSIMGESEGIVNLTGDDATDSITFWNSDEPCILHFHFKPGHVEVDAGNVESCGWGYGVRAEGTYHKSTKLKPDFRSNAYGETYKVMAAKSFFYEDSLLTKPKKSYLVKGNKMKDLTDHIARYPDLSKPSHTIYTEIYNKKHLTLTYGWIAKKDLMRLPDK